MKVLTKEEEQAHYMYVLRSIVYDKRWESGF
jgi:hypothetical protein